MLKLGPTSRALTMQRCAARHAAQCSGERYSIGSAALFMEFKSHPLTALNIITCVPLPPPPPPPTPTHAHAHAHAPHAPITSHFPSPVSSILTINDSSPLFPFQHCFCPDVVTGELLTLLGFDITPVRSHAPEPTPLRTVVSPHTQHLILGATSPHQH